MRPRRIGYAKLGRSMPLTLDKCGSNGGDVEMLPTLKLLAERHPDVEFILIGRNSGELPTDVGLPTNVANPWIAWRHAIRRDLNDGKLNHPNWSIDEHRRVRDILAHYTRATIENLDGVVMWIGQHGTTNTPLPSVSKPGELTKPYDWSTLYCSYLQQGINAWRDADPLIREEVLLNADPRNIVKYRDSKWPWRHPVLSQYDVTNRVKHERYGAGKTLFNDFATSDENDAAEWNHTLSANLGYVDDGAIWTSRTRSVYARLEISGLLPGTPFADTIQFNNEHRRRHDFGIVFNETKREVAIDKSRRRILQKWVLPLNPGFIYGKWSPATQRQLDVKIEPLDVADYFATLQTARCTLTTPSSGSGWATAKPWEAFAAGVVCFFHPAYDDQNHILADAPRALSEWLRIQTPADLRVRVDYMRESPQYWRDIIMLQREHYLRAVDEMSYIREIERRLYL